MKKSIPAKTPKEAVCEKSGSGSGDNGFEDFWKSGSDPMTSREKIVLGWTQMGVYSQPPGRPKS